MSTIIKQEYYPFTIVTHNFISTFSVHSRGRYLCLWTICPPGYPLPSSQCIDTNMVYYIYFSPKFTLPKSCNF